MPTLTPKTLDSILTLQLLIAWLGEERRLGWWRTQLLDEEMGIDVMTYDLGLSQPEWAAWRAAREAARRVDARLRAEHPDAAGLTSLLHWGVELDEQFDDRMAELRRSGKLPTEALPLLADLLGAHPYAPSWSPQAPEDHLQALPQASVERTTVGRRLRGPMPEPVACAQQLARAHLPLEPGPYPLPHRLGLWEPKT